MTWETDLMEIKATIDVLCTCQQRNIPANGCAICEGEGMRQVQVRRDGTVRWSLGVYGWGAWFFQDQRVSRQ